jgi:hypothetical protein
MRYVPLLRSSVTPQSSVTLVVQIDTLDDRVDNIQSKLDAFEKSLNENGVASVGTTDIAPAVKKVS